MQILIQYPSFSVNNSETAPKRSGSRNPNQLTFLVTAQIEEAEPNDVVTNPELPKAGARDSPRSETFCCMETKERVAQRHQQSCDGNPKLTPPSHAPPARHAPAFLLLLKTLLVSFLCSPPRPVTVFAESATPIHFRGRSQPPIWCEKRYQPREPRSACSGFCVQRGAMTVPSRVAAQMLGKV